MNRDSGAIRGPSICVNVVEALAKVEDTHPSDLDFVLYDHVNVEAIQLLSREGNGTWELTFEALDHTVSVDSEDTITIDGEVFESDP